VTTPHCDRLFRTIPRKSPSPLPPLSKGGGLTARHKLSLCCFLLAICPPFLYCKLFCRQDRGIATPPSLAPHQPFIKPHYPLLCAITLASPRKRGGGLTARHKLSLCCVLLATHPPFLFTKLFCRQDGGIVTPLSLAPHHPSKNRTITPAFRNAIICVLVWFCI